MSWRRMQYKVVFTFNNFIINYLCSVIISALLNTENVKSEIKNCFEF